MTARNTATPPGGTRRQPAHPLGGSGRDHGRRRLPGERSLPGGLKLQPLVGKLDAFPRPHAWSIYLRRPLLRLSQADRELLDTDLRPLLTAPDQAVPTYPSPAGPPHHR